jgi:two-component system cell cycle sensor histidine kinase/response regulator CckA
MKDNQKTKTQLLGEVADLRRQVQKQETIQKAGPADEEKYRTILEHIEDGYYEVDLTGKYTFVNPSVCKYHGRSPEELIGQSFRKFFSNPEAAQIVFKIFNEMFRTGLPADLFVYQIIRKDGEIRDLEMSASVILDAEGKPVGFRGIGRDVTDRKRWEIEQERYRDFVENISDWCFETDLRGKFTFANEAILRRGGYARESFVGTESIRFSDPEEAQIVREVFNEVYRTGLPSKLFEYKHTRRNGEIGYVQMAVSLIRDKTGKPIGYRGVSRDITELKNLEAEQERFSNFVKNITDGCFEVDLAGNMTFFNEAACRMFGYPPEEFLGMNNRAYTSPETAKKTFNIFNEIYRTGVPEKIFDYEINRKNGEIGYLEMSASLIRDKSGKPVGFRGVSRDITERKKMETEQERSRDFVENIADGCWELDLAGNITFINESACRMMGYPREELLGMNNRAYTSPETAKQMFKVFSEIYRTGLPEKISYYPVVRKDGNTIFMELSASLSRDEAGNRVGFRGITRDLTERKLAEAEKSRLEEQLNQARKLEAVGTLAGGVAHDFNNLLMGIQGYTSLMLLDTDPSHPFYEKFKAIEAQVRSAADLTRQLLGYARGGRYEVKPTNLNELIGKTASLFGRTKKGVRIHETFAKDLWKVEADQGQMEQVLLNLFMNAWQAMPGGGTIYLQTENVLLDESYVEPYGKAPGPFVKISVTDTGVGMDRETTGRIFEPFFTTKEMGRGTGLGLATTYGIISGHGGIITVYSEKGYGTTFNLYLPSSKKELIQEIRSSRETMKGKETLLLVDDEKIITEVTGAMITHLGYQLLIAHNGEEAVEIYRANPGRIDLVILDMIMSGIGGGEAFDLIKSINPQAKIILSSGFSLNGQAKEILNRGARTFLQKPFRFDDFSRIIKEVLEAP